jgi:hypothetical protein
MGLKAPDTLSLGKQPRYSLYGRSVGGRYEEKENLLPQPGTELHSDLVAIPIELPWLPTILQMPEKIRIPQPLSIQW